MALSIKAKAIEVLLSDGVTKVLVYEPRTSDLPLFLRAIPALSAMGKLLKGVDKEEVLAMPEAPVKDEDLADIYPLLAIMTQYTDETGERSLTVDEFKSLPVWDGIFILKTFTAFVPKSMSPTLTPEQSVS
jgi:hypothetical protein